ncbi:FtsX-like permease family protein [Maribellus comscasis]|uniref:FtsX-like permease family protein n=1 Tax=Maribellus comscasis TaxID=2681766 RepID=A0A6I6JWY6_9BACT|nr:FtsX-like permease family protein [Maribellus comscasis]QGY44657.1 FtsX-like permease family protein [Maribellus comscasis]
MITNYIKLSWRQFLKNRTLSFAKLIGLGIAFAVVLFVTTYVCSEYSFDNFIPGKDSIYRVYRQGTLDGQNINSVITSPLLAEYSLKEIPEVAEALRIQNQGNAFVEVNNEVNNVSGAIYADPNFLDFFQIPYTKTSSLALPDKNSVAISEKLALMYFKSEENALGHELKIKYGTHYESCFISSVFRDLPPNSHLEVNLIKNINQVIDPASLDWETKNTATYLKTGNKITDKNELNFKLTKLAYAQSDIDGDGVVEKINENNFTELVKSENVPVKYYSEPLQKIHLSNHAFDFAVTSSKIYLYGAMAIAFILFLISGINFINLTLASHSLRLKEIGVRKTHGAFRIQLTKMLLTEAIFHWTLSFALGVIIYAGTKNLLTQHLNLSIYLEDFDLFKVLFYSFCGITFFSIFINFIPISYYSRLNILSLLNSKRSKSKSQIGSKNALIVVQFALSVIIILSTLIVQKQLSYLNSKNRAYGANNIVMFRLYDLNRPNRLSFMEKLKSFASVEEVSLLNQFIGDDPEMVSVYFNHSGDAGNQLVANRLLVDGDYFQTYGLKLLKGRGFSENRNTDYDCVILNETAAREFPGKDDILNQFIINDDKTYKVVGVVKDYNYKSLHHKIEPLLIFRGRYIGNLAMKISSNQTTEAIAALSSLWGEYKIKRPLYYQFLDDALALKYNKDKQAKKLMLILSVLSILVACIGLYAILFFSIKTRVKELAIRKINGASEVKIGWLIVSKYMLLITISVAISVPFCVFIMRQWLNNFAYKTTLSWWIFALAGVLALGIALLTVAFQSFKAATRNPAEALRYE